MVLLLGIMTVSLGLFVSSAKAVALTAVAIAVIFLASNFTIATNAQQQLPNTTQPPSVTHSPTLLNKKDSFRVQLPEGWVIQDINNTGFTLAAEALQGYGILAELCPQEHEQGQAVLRNVGRSSSSGSNTYIGSCQQAREEVIHIVRYPNLGAKLGITSDDDDNIFTIINRDTIPNAILDYHIQKLKEVGYRDIQIVSSTDTTINVDNSTGLNNHRIPTTVPAKLVEMTYNTNFAPNETRTGYFLLTATAATPRNLGMVTGYSIFYEGNSTTAETTTTSSGSLAPRPLPPSIKQIFDSFELIAARTNPLTVDITSSETEGGGIAPATFEFEADVTGGIEPYAISWNFGDDGSSEENDDDVEHTFDVAGTYNVDVSITDSSGRTASDSMRVTVEPPPPLTAVEIISSGTEGIAPATFEFEANVTGGTGPYTYSWNFGDGSVEVDDDETISHTFDLGGTYNVDLTVTDSTGRTSSDSILITVVERPRPSLTAVEIISSGTEGIAPATFEFGADVVGGTGPYTYSWNFGDGSVEVDDDDVAHTFEEAGTYSVGLTVTDSSGQSASDSIGITITDEEPPGGEEPPTDEEPPGGEEPPTDEEPPGGEEPPTDEEPL
jgi:PKD repeat protein